MNSITFAGQLAADPEIRYTVKGTAVVELRVLVNRRVKSAAGEWEDAPATLHRVKQYGRQAENVVESVTTGSRVLVTGRLITETYEKDGETKYANHVVADEIGVSTKYAVAVPQKVTPIGNAPEEEEPPF